MGGCMEMEKVTVTVYSNEPHISQILTGFCILENTGKYDVEFVDKRTEGFACGMAIVEAEYKNQQIIYDCLDGYQRPAEIKCLLKNCDFYFKRSFSPQKNESVLHEYTDKMYPLGLSYMVTYPNLIINEPKWKEIVKRICGKETKNIFYPGLFEGKAIYKNSSEEKNILFLTRLWDWSAREIENDSVREERENITMFRIELCRKLKEQFRDSVIIGISDSELARRYANDCIMPAKYTKKRNYLKLLHKSDICIGTMGLHESIGWKTAEYVAAAKAIVNEKLHYEVTGNFEKGKNYLEANTVQEILDAVKCLKENPDFLYEMKKANEEYYANYLKPDRLVENTLHLVAGKI